MVLTAWRGRGATEGAGSPVSRMSPGRWENPGEGWGSLGNRIEDSPTVNVQIPFPVPSNPRFRPGVFHYRRGKGFGGSELPRENGVSSGHPRGSLFRSRKYSKAEPPIRRLLRSLPDVSHETWCAHRQDHWSYPWGNSIRKAAPQAYRQAHRRFSAGCGLGLIGGTSKDRNRHTVRDRQDGSSPVRLPPPTYRGGFENRSWGF